MESIEGEYYEMKLGEIIIYNKNFFNLWMGIRSRIDLDCKEKKILEKLYTGKIQMKIHCQTRYTKMKE